MERRREFIQFRCCFRCINNLRAADIHRRISCYTGESAELMNILRFVYALLTACNLEWCLTTTHEKPLTSTGKASKTLTLFAGMKVECKGNQCWS